MGARVLSSSKVLLQKIMGSDRAYQVHMAGNLNVLPGKLSPLESYNRFFYQKESFENGDGSQTGMNKRKLLQLKIVPCLGDVKVTV